MQRALVIVALCLSVVRPAFAEDSVSVTLTPSKLVITVITSESDIPTLQARVGSWFSDGTQVSVNVAADLPPESIFKSSPSEVRAWVVLLSPERALVMFAAPPGPEPARYLLREVRLLNGLDELGLERLASVIHSASVALHEGVEGTGRPEVEKELALAGLLRSPAPPEAAPVPEPQASIVPAPTKPPVREVRAKTRAAAILLAAGYAARLRGTERLGHGPLVSAGLQLPGPLGPMDALLSAQLMFRSQFDAGALAASVQTNAFRAHFGLEPSLSSRVKLQALLGAGADWARIRSHVAATSANEQLTSRNAGSQWRGALELSLGVWWSTRLVDFGALASTTFLLGDVHYSLVSDGSEQRLVTPWPVEPALSLQARFRSTP
jgi:hypothetical protein